MTNKTTAFKAFNTDMKCRGFQYEIGKTYEHEGSVELCSTGFHSCTIPFDCLDYYRGSTNFAVVSYDGSIAVSSDDSKIVGAKITIEASLSLPEWIKRQAETIINLCKSAKGTLSVRAHAATTGYNAHAATTGYNAHAATTGDRAHAATTGNRAHAATTGDRAHTATTGDNAHAATTGKWGAAVSLGIFGQAKSGDGGWITLAHYNDDYELINVQTRKVGKHGLKPDTFYTRDAKNGKFIECES